jgi:hypothetical protein
MPVISAFRRLRQGDLVSKQKNKKQKNQEKETKL